MTLGGSSRTKDLIRRFDALSAVHDAAKRPLWLREAGSVGVGRKHNPPEPATTTAAMHEGQLLTAATTVAPGLSTENGGGSDNHNSSNFTISQLPAAAPTAAPRATPAAPATADSNGIDGDMSDIGVNEDIALQLMSPAVHKSSQFASDAGVDQSTQKQRTRTIPELAEAAKIDTQKIQASSKAWLATAQSCYDRARICQINDELEDAFIYYMKFTTIIMEIVPRQGDYKSIKLSPKMKELRSLLSTEVMTSMEKIKSELKQRPIAAPVEEMPEPRSPASRSVQGEIDDFNQRYPEAPPTPPVVSDPAISQAQVHDTYSSFHHRFSEIDNQARQISKDTETLKSLITHTNTGADALPSGTASSGPHYNLPVTCTPESLREWLLHIQKAELTNEPIPFTLLILDVRSNNEFVWGHIKTNNIVNIDPIGLREGCTSAQIENSLVLESETSQELFRNRNKFDIIVYMDSNSESLHPQSSKHQQQAKILRTLVDAIYHNELEKPLYRPPILLSGGFDAWIRRIGDEGTKWCPERSAPSKGPSWVPSDLCMPASSSNLPTPRYGQVHRVPSSELQRRRVATVLDDSKADAIRDALTAQNMAPLIAIQPLPSSRSSVYDLFRGPQYSYVGNPSYPAPGGSYADQGPPRYMPPLTQFAQARLENASATVEPVVASRRDTIFDDPLYAFTGARDALGPRSQPVNLSVISPPTKSTIDYPTVASREIASPLPSSPKPPLPQPPPVTRISKLPKRPPLPPKPEAYKGLENAPATFTPAPVAPRPSLQPVKPVTPTPTAGPSTSVIRDSYTDISVAFTQPSVGVMTNHRTMNIGTTGLKNFGYTCYMNAVIQCLVGTLPFARYFLQGNWRRDARVSGSESLSIASESRSKNLLSRPHRIASHLKLRHSGNSNSNNNKQNNGMQLVLEFSKLVDHMWSGQFTSLSPTGFKDAVGALAPQFKPNEQQDCQEFASFLLNRLHETLNRVKAQPPPTPPMTAAEETEFERLPDIAQSNRQWGQFIRRNWSIVTSIFQGQLQSRLKCLTCGQTSTTYSEFTELSVPIPISSSAAGDGGEASSSQVLANMGRNLKFTLYQCLDKFVSHEILDGDDAWRCPQCQQKRRATKRLMISRLPLVLIIHLKRFIYHGLFRDKIESLVTFPIDHLDMTKYVLSHISDPQQQQLNSGQAFSETQGADNLSTSYRLYAVANHYGTLTGGHYTANVFNGHLDEWNNFDDTRVSRIMESKIVSPAAYLLCFVRT